MRGIRIWWFGTALVIATVLALGWLLGVSPLLAQAASAAAERANVEQTNQLQAARLAQMRQQYERLDEIAAELEELKRSVPSEVDSDVIYDYLWEIQQATGAPVATIMTGEAQPYGVADPTAGGAGGAAGIPNLHTVPVDITFRPTATVAQVLAFAGALQDGPRLFLVTDVVATEHDGRSSAAISAFMFVISDPDDTPGSAGTGAAALHGR